MACKICGSPRVKVIYNDTMRQGGIGHYTKQAVPLYQCEECHVIWHDEVLEDLAEYYESKEYRDSLGEKTVESYYENHDKETLDKFQYTGTEIFRGKTVADIGCAAGAFLDYLFGVANAVIGIEPSQMFRDVMNKKGYHTYAYARDAFQDWSEKVDVITSFDVIEHVTDPLEFLKDVYKLLGEHGRAIIGTPTNAPVICGLLNGLFERKTLYTVQHLWIFSAESLKKLAAEAGFTKIEVRYFQRYGIENLLGWCLEGKPNSYHNSFFSGEIDAVWRSACSSRGMADYSVLYVEK